MDSIHTGIRLRHTGDNARAFFRPISGEVEKGLHGSTTADLVLLIDQLIDRRSGASNSATDPNRLTASDRDRLVAAIHREIYGDRIGATLRCRACDSAFDIDFQLSSLQAHLYREQPAASADGTYQTPQGYLFQLPDSEDEIEISSKPQSDAYAYLLERVLIDPTYQSLLAGSEAHCREVIDAVESQLNRIAPIIDLDMNACCPECGVDQAVHFDLQRFFLERLLLDRHWLLHEIHTLANAYRWRLDDILKLSRKDRKELTDLIDDQRLGNRRSA
jgi:hypothetical protein